MYSCVEITAGNPVVEVPTCSWFSVVSQQSDAIAKPGQVVAVGKAKKLPTVSFVVEELIAVNCPATVEDACERNPKVNVCFCVHVFAALKDAPAPAERQFMPSVEKHGATIAATVDVAGVEEATRDVAFTTPAISNLCVGTGTPMPKN